MVTAVRSLRSETRCENVGIHMSLGPTVSASVAFTIFRVSNALIASFTVVAFAMVAAR